MLGVFKNGVIDPPRELHSPGSSTAPATATAGAGAPRSKTPDDTLKDFLNSNPKNGFSVQFVDKAMLAHASPQATPYRSLFCGVDDVYCIFMGDLNNLCHLNKQYGLTKCGNDALFVIEAYRTLRDRSPMPAHQVLKELQGSFAFVIYDHRYGTVFAALGADKALNLFWGVSADGSVMISDNVALIKASCRKSYAPFPPGCMYHSDRGLISFEHPMHKMKAMPRIDSEGAMCGSYFAVDAYSKVNSMPRVGSSANWATIFQHITDYTVARRMAFLQVSYENRMQQAPTRPSSNIIYRKFYVHGCRSYTSSTLAGSSSKPRLPTNIEHPLKDQLSAYKQGKEDS